MDATEDVRDEETNWICIFTRADQDGQEVTHVVSGQPVVTLHDAELLPIAWMLVRFRLLLWIIKKW